MPTEKDKKRSLERIRGRLRKNLHKAHFSILNVTVDASLNEQLRGVAALVGGECTLIRLGNKPISNEDVQVLKEAFEKDRPVVLGFFGNADFPLLLLASYESIWKHGVNTVIDSKGRAPVFPFSISNDKSELKDLVFLRIKSGMETPDDLRESMVYILLGEFEAFVLAEAGKEQDFGIQRIGASD